MKIKKVPFYFRILDYIMIPVMWGLCGFYFEKPQETHPWHMRKFPKIEIPKNKKIEIIGKDKSKHTNKGRLLFHVPLFGGWKDYIILEAKGFDKYWQIGWIIEFYDNSEALYQVQALPIFESKIKLLTGINDSKKTFFGLDKKGNFVDLKQIDSGKIGDGKNKDVRLF